MKRPYFFEIFTIVNFAALDIALLRITPAPLTTLGHSLVTLLPLFLIQTAIGVAIRAMWRRRDYLRAIWSAEWLADTARLVVFSALSVHTYGWIKLAIPLMHPHLFDQTLWNVDRALFFGHSPNIFVLDLFSRPAALLGFFDWTYANVFVASINIASIVFLSAPQRRLRIGFMNSNTLMWIAGAWLYVLVPSLGPAYRFPEVWLPLAAMLAHTQGLQHILMTNYQHVLRDRAGNILFGIAAFPSLHVAFEVLVYLWMRRVSRVGTIAFAVFAILIFLGSVITGWHYLIDSIAGVALALACYFAASRGVAAGASPAAVRAGTPAPTHD